MGMEYDVMAISKNHVAFRDLKGFGYTSNYSSFGHLSYLRLSPFSRDTRTGEMESNGTSSAQFQFPLIISPYYSTERQYLQENLSPKIILSYLTT